MNLIQAVESRYLVKVMTDKKINDAYNWGVALFKSDDVHEFDFKHILRLVNHLVREDHEEIFSYGTSICTKDNEINIFDSFKIEFINSDKNPFGFSGRLKPCGAFCCAGADCVCPVKSS